VNVADDVALLVRVTGGLFVVLVVVAIVARLARRAKGFGAGDHLRVVERVGLSRDAYVAVVEAGGRSLLLGVSPAGMSLLAPLDLPAPAPAPAGPLHIVVETTSGPAGRHPPTGRDGGRHAAPGPGDAPGDAADGRLAMPHGVDLGGYPDLASALRAAGRTVAPGGGARAAGAPAPAPPAAPAPAPPARRDRRTTAARVPQQRAARPASGSVLSPATWRQGIEALRERTVRRG
jgi:hypothetical protein